MPSHFFPGFSSWHKMLPMEFRIEQKIGPFLQLYKLNYDGNRGCTLQWIKKFLIRQETASIDWMNVLWLCKCELLSPLLFLAYINDLPDMVTSNVKVLADDCLIYKTNQPTTQSNKEDLNALGKWKKWLAGGISPAEMYHHPYLKKRYPIKSIVPTA